MPQQLRSLAGDETDRLTLLPEDVVGVAEYFSCPSIAYTYSEPIVWFEYMIDIAAAARAKKIKNCWITCGYIQEEPLLELCKVTDAANVNLKSFDEEIYRELNTGTLEPILATLKTLKREGVWFEVTNLGGAHVHRQAPDDPADVRLAAYELGAGLSAALLPFPAGPQAHAPAAHAGRHALGSPGNCPLGRGELRLRGQLSGSVRRRDDLLPGVQEGRDRVQHLQRVGDAA